jgi:hypothetical protein
MRTHSRVVLASVVGVGVLMILLLGFHLGGEGLLKVANFSPLLGALIGGTLTLVCVNLPFRWGEDVEPWLGHERLAWILIGCGCVAWGIGESFWRYYEALGQSPFPSLADFGYASFPPLVFAGLILLPSSRSGQRRRFLLLDSLISMGALLSIAWFLLLGSLAQTPAESALAKVLGLYYPSVDTALVSCSVFLLLRGAGGANQASARRISLLVAGLGLCVFATSDFLFNVQQNLGTYAEGSWVDLGWPLGLMALGVAAYLRRFLPATPDAVLEQRLKRRAEQLHLGPAQAVPYLLLVVLFCVLVLNVLSGDSTQQSIRPVLVGATVIVVGLVLARQILTLLDNALLVRKQRAMFQELEGINQSIAERNVVLEAGVTHLKEIQTRLANGDVRARAQLMKGELWPLAVGLNVMADRMMRSERSQREAQKLAKAVDDFIQALERARSGMPLVLPAHYLHVPEMRRLLHALDLKPASETPQSAPHPVPPRPGSPRLPPIPETPAASFHRQPPAPPVRQQPPVEQPFRTSRLRRDV